CRIPRVAADGNPGLDDANPSGLKNSGRSAQDSALNTQHFPSALPLSTSPQHSPSGLLQPNEPLLPIVCCQARPPVQAPAYRLPDLQQSVRRRPSVVPCSD